MRIKTKFQISYAVSAQLISVFCFRFTDSTIPCVSFYIQNSKLLAFSCDMPVCVLPDQKPVDRFSRVTAHICTAS